MQDRFNELKTKKLNELQRINYRGYTIIAFSMCDGTAIGFNVYDPSGEYLIFLLSTKRAKDFVNKYIKMKEKGTYFRVGTLEF